MSRTQFALVTGASSGIGLQVVESLLERGFFVFGASRTEMEIEDDNLLEIEVELADETSVAEMFSQIREVTDGLDLVVHAAGVFEYGELGHTLSDSFQEVFNSNTLGTFHLYKHLEEFLLARSTHIINFLSHASKKPYKYMSSFCAAEAGKMNFINSMKAEWKSKKIKITNVFVGAVDTPFWDNLEIRVDRRSMLDLDELMYVFDTLVDASPRIQFHDITLSHIDDENE